MDSFGARLKVTIDARGRSQADVARAAGLKGPSISDWFGDKVQPDKVKAWPLLKAAAFLEVSPIWLLTGMGSPEPTSATVLLAQEGKPAPYNVWPFEHVPPARYYSLPDQTRLAIASYVNGVVLGVDSRNADPNAA